MNRGLERARRRLRQGHHRSIVPEGKTERWRPESLARVDQAGGADRARTGDPLVANQVLSQLSYSPVSCGWWA